MAYFEGYLWEQDAAKAAMREGMDLAHANNASVARCTSTGLAPNDAVERRTAKLSTSSISTMVCGLRAAISGMVSVISVVMLR